MNRIIFVLLLGLFISPNTWAIDLDELDDEQEDVSETGLSVEWSGLFDFRLAHTGTARNWADPNSESSSDSLDPEDPNNTNYGGPGLTRYGRTRGKDSGIGIHLAQISLVPRIEINETTSIELQLNYSDHRDSNQRDSGFGQLGLAEGFLKEEFNDWLSIRLGFLIPQISTEHPEVAWSTRYSITPSAINTWVGEEVRAMAAEITAKVGENWEFTLAPFSHNDSVATMLTYRGWALHDYQGTYGSRLRWNQVPAAVNKTQGWVSPFKEVDDRLGYYGRVGFKSDDSRFKTALFYYDNQANPGAFDGANYGWDTQFTNLSVEYDFGNGLKAITQGMAGTTNMGPDVVVADFFSSFLLFTYKKGSHRITTRYDLFNVTDEDKTATTNVTDDESKGRAFTIAYFWSLSEMKTLGLEWVYVDSERNGNEGFGDRDPDDNLAQLMYRMTF